MCVILHHLQGQPIDIDDLSDAAWHNPDGAGLMWSERGKVHVHKGMWDAERIVDECLALGSREFVLHLRIAMHGNIDTANCHPFHVGDGTWMMHNGILPIDTPREDRSDTWHFAQLFKQKKIGAHVKRPKVASAVESAIGQNNKLCFLLPDGHVVRIGKWHNHDGNMWSNLCWQALPIADRRDWLRSDPREEREITTQWWLP